MLEVHTVAQKLWSCLTCPFCIPDLKCIIATLDTLFQKPTTYTMSKGGKKLLIVFHNQPWLAVATIIH